jgi:CRP-like cAMP-binding protein
MTSAIRDEAPAPEALKQMELFAGLPMEALAGVAAMARGRHLPRETRIFSQGDPGVRTHAVIAGGVRISQSGSDGAQIVVRFVGPGEMFGTVALFTDGRYPADAVTIAETFEASWSEADLRILMARYPQIAINMIRIIGTRLQEVQERVRELATQNAERRVAHAVLRLARQAGQAIGGGTAIAFPLRRKDMADIAGTTLHTASRILTGWTKQGLVASRNRRLIVLKPGDIQRIAEQANG